MTANQRRLLVLIMMVAAFLRAEYLLQIEHNVDHAYPIWQAMQTLDRGIFPLTGQGTSVLFANPPLAGYLYLPIVAITRSPLGVYVPVIALNTLAVLLAFRTARLIVGINLALIAAFLMAVNPWVIEYSRTSWVQSLLPFWICALAWALFPVLLGRAKRPARRLVIAFLILTALAQSYLLGFLMIVPVGVLIAIFWRRIPKRALALGVTIFAVAVGLYGAGLLSQREALARRLADFGANPAHLSGEALGHALRLITGSDYAIARGTFAPIGDWELRQDLSNVAHTALVVVLVVGVGVAIWRIWHGEGRDKAIIVLVWFGLPIALMSYVGQAVHPFYQLLGLPAGYVLVAWGIESLIKPRANKIGKLINGGIALPFCALIVLFWFLVPLGLGIDSFSIHPLFQLLGLVVGFILIERGMRKLGTSSATIAIVFLLLPFGVLMGINSARYYEETAATPGMHGLGALSLEYGLQLGAAVRENLPGTVYADVDEWILSSFSGETLDFVRDARANAFNFIPPSGMYVALYKAGEIENTPLGVRDSERIALPDGSVIVVDHLSQQADRGNAQALNVPSDQGITLEGYDLAQAGEQWTLTTYWRVDQRVEGIDQRLFAPFAHIFDADGNRVLIVDGQAVPGYEWRVGELHAHRMTFSLPEGEAPFTIRVGQYDSVNGVNAIFLLPDGEYSPVVELEEAISR